MTVYRTRDPIYVGRIINQPHMLEACGYPKGAVADFSEIVGRPDYILLTNGADAFALFHGPHAAVWEAHSACDVSCRGRKAIRFWRECFEWMWANTPARMIVAAPYSSNRAACWMCRQVGMTIGKAESGRTWFCLASKIRDSLRSSGAKYLSYKFVIDLVTY